MSDRDRLLLLVRWVFVFATLLPVGWLLGWIAAGEANHALISNPDLLNLYQGDLGASYGFFWDSWIWRTLLSVGLGIGLTRYVTRVKGPVLSVVTGVCLAATSAAFLYAVTRYPEAETRLALSPYKATSEDASWWALPFSLAFLLICVILPWFEEPSRST